MLLNKTKTLVFLFTIFISSFTFSQTQTLYSSACDALNELSGSTLTYTDDNTDAIFSDGDTADLTDASNSGFSDGSTYYYNYIGSIYEVTFNLSGSDYEISVGITPVTCDSGAGGSQQTLYSSACDALNELSGSTLTYTDDNTDAIFSDGDTADLTDASNSGFSDGSTYYYNYIGSIYEVTFNLSGSDYEISVGITPVTCDSGAGGSQQTLYSSACDALNELSGSTLTYTDDNTDAIFSDGDTADLTDASNSGFSDGSTYYYNYIGSIYEVTFNLSGSDYEISVGITPVTCDSGAGGSQQTLYSSACDALNELSGSTLTYTDDNTDAIFSDGDTADLTDASNSGFSDGSTYYYNYIGSIYEVTFNLSGSDYEISVGITPVTCDSGAGGSQQTLYSSACDALNELSGSTLTYTDDNTDAIFSDGDTADLTDASNSGFSDGSTYYYNYIGSIYEVTFNLSGSDYEISVGITPVTCDSGAGGSQQTLYSSACDALNELSGSTLTYTDDNTDAIFSDGDTADLTDASNSGFSDGSTYYYNYIGSIYEVTFNLSGSDYEISVGITPVTCDSGAGGSQQTLYSSACDALNELSGSTLTYTDDNTDAIFSDGDTADLTDASNSGFSDGSTYYYNYIGSIYEVTFNLSGSDYEISVGITPVTCDSGAGGSQQTLYSSACDALNELSGSTLTYTDDNTDAIFSDGDTADLTDASNSGFSDGSTYYYNYIGSIYEVTFNLSGSDYEISVGITPVTCDSGAGGSQQTLYSSACDALNELSGSTLTYTDDNTDAIFSDGDTADLTDASNSGFSDGSTYYYNYIGSIYEVTFNLSGSDYEISVGITPVTCDSGAGENDANDDGTHLIYDSAANACSQDTDTALSLNLTDASDNSLDLEDAFNSGNSPDIGDFSATYFYNDGSNTYLIKFTSYGPGEYKISEKNLINCAPSFTSEASFTAPENQLAIGDAIAIDPDANATLVYSISGTELEIDASTGVITFAADPDFETKNLYTATVTVTDGTNPVEQEITVTISDVDEISPEFDETPSTSSVAQTKFTLNADINEEGIIYYVVVADGALAPSSSEVRAGTGNGGTGELASGNATVDSGDYIYDFIVSGLTGGTAYDVYLVAEDNEAIPNLQAIPEKLDVTTAELISLTISGITGGDKVYDDTTAASASGTATLVGVEAGDDVILRGSPVFTFASANVGTDITITTTGYTISGTDLGNYTLTQPTLSGDITAAPLIVTAIDQTKVYGETDPSLTYTITGFVNGEDEADLDTEVSISRAVGEDVDTYTITPSAAADSNYTISFVTADFTITAAPLTVTASDQTKVYGATDPVLTYSITGFQGTDTEADLDTGVSISRAVGEDVDTYTISPSAAADSNYTVSFVTADFAITAADLTVTASDQTKVYGATDPALTYSITGFQGTDTESDLDTEVSISRAVGETVGTYTITPSAATDSNYTVSFVTADFAITAADLTVTASDQTKVYGATDPVLTYSITGFQGTDTEADLDTGVSISRAVGEDVDTYTITPSAAADSNYTVSFVTADFTITAADLTVTADADTKVYGATDPALTYSITGFQGTDTEADLDTGVSISRAVGEDVGTYTITPSAADSNYTVSFVTADFAITAADLTVTASDQTKVYGATDPTLSYTITGFVNGEDESDLDTGVSISRAVGEDVDTYTITPSAADSNYTVSFVTADFAITAADLTVTASDQTKVYGATDPTLTYSITGFQGTDTEADLDTGVSISRAVGEDVDTYTITPSGAADSNYTVSFVTADFTITAADLTVTADADTKVYGATDPALTYSITGFQGTDTEADLDTGVSISRAVGEDVGTYTITPSAAADSNYTISFVTADFTITAADLTVTASDQTKVYGATDPALSYTITGFVNDEDESDLDTAVSISRAVGEDVGTYTITPSAAADSNYTVSFVTADFAITAADLTVTASDQTKVYGATDPTLTYSITGFQGTDTEADLDTAVSISRAAGEAVGTYTITPSAAADSNYTVSFVTADFAITAADLTVTASDQTKVYGATDPTLTYSITGFQGTDTEADLDTGVSISRAAGEAVGTYTITPSGAADSNYTVSFVTADFTITAADLTVTADADTKVYGATDPALTYSITGFQGTDTEADLDTGVSISRAVGEDVGTYTITPSAAADSNYTISFVTADFTITAADLTVTASDQTKVYGATDPALSYTITGFVNDEDESDLDTAVSISRAVGEDVGTYTITPSAAADSNYTVSFVTADFTITAADLTVTASDQTKVYGATDPTLTYSITGFQGTDTEADLDTAVSISRAAGEDVGTYTITPSAAADSNYTVSFVTADFTITAADLTVTASDQTKVYGATDPTLTYSITGFQGTDTEADLDTAVSISRAAGEDVGTYTITPSAAADSNYTVSFVTADFTITAADLTVTASDQTKVYGATDPTLTYSITGFQGTDTEADLDTAVSISRAAGEDVGTYTITPSAAADSNYTVSFVTADFTITAADLTVTASDQTKVYGATDPTLTYSITGFQGTDTEADLDTAVSISRAVGEDVGTYTITPSAAADSNYTVSFVTADFAITAADLTVTASDQTKVYGATDPTLTYSITGFQGTDTEADLDTAVSISRAVGEDVGTYTITPSAAADSNYTVSFVTADFAITAADLTVTASDQTKVYGATDPTLTYSITGFQGTDTEADLDTGVSISRAVGEDVGTYTITPSAAADSNYTVSFVTADFAITAADLTVTASDQTKVYGATDPTLTYSITGFQGTDTEADLDTGVSISRAVGEDVGTYTITPSAAADSNYTVSFVTADFTITAADLTVTASDQTKVYGATDPDLTYSITGFQGTDTEADLDTGVSISRAVGEDVGTYTITPSAAADSNYTVSFVTADFTITAADLTVTASDQTKVYGATDPTLTYSITGFQGTDTEADLDTAVSISRAVGEDVGTYTITPSAAADSNYTVSFVTADFTITAADLTVTASDQTKVYGATDPTLTYSITGFQGTDTEADLDTAVSISRAVGEDVGTYTITPSAAADSNYTVSFVTADFAITAADLTVTASDQTKVYGATDPTLTYSITGFQGTDTEADLDTAVSISRAVGEDVGTYTITPSAAADSNYTVSFVTADFTITAAA